MSGPFAGPSRLGFTLIPSTILSALTCILYFTVQHEDGSLIFFPILLFTFFYNARYLFRYLQLRVAMKRERSENLQWPDKPFFPGELERKCFRPLALFTVWFYLMGNMWISPSLRGDASPRVSEGALLATYWLYIVVGYANYFQAGWLARCEDGLVCTAKGHKLQCTQCGYLEAKLATEPRPHLPKRLSPFLHPSRILVVSSFLSMMVMYTFQIHFGAKDQKKALLLMILPLLTFLHNTYFLFRLMYISCRTKHDNAPAWPAAPIFARASDIKAYSLGLLLVWELYLVGIVMWCSEVDEWRFWRGERTELTMGSAYLALCFVTAVGAFSGYYILTNEAKIKCDAEGHAWKCTRKCKKDTQTLLPPAIEKVDV